MPQPFHFLVAESEAPEDREARRQSVGRSSGETYADILRDIAPGSRCDQTKPAEEDPPSEAALRGYDAVFLCGSPMHVYEETAGTRRLLDFMRAVFRAGTPAFGSCAGLQVAVAAAGGEVGPRSQGEEAGFARRITPTAEGRAHPMLDGRPAAYDAPALHSDEVKRLPPGAVLLATSGVTAVQATEIRFGGGVFWGVQYHPELSLGEVAQALRRQSDSLVGTGLARTPEAVERQAGLLDALAKEPGRRDLAWQLGLDRQTTDRTARQAELRNFIRHLAEPRRAARCGGYAAARPRAGAG